MLYNGNIHKYANKMVPLNKYLQHHAHALIAEIKLIHHKYNDM